MTYPQLTGPTGFVTQPPAKEGAKAGTMAGQNVMRWRGLLIAGTLGLGGCINLTAPTEPIVIELNINITQEVIYRLAEDATDAIEENADIF